MYVTCTLVVVALAATPPPHFAVEQSIKWLLPSGTANAPLNLLATKNPQPGDQMQQLVQATTSDLEKLSKAPQRSKEGVRLILGIADRYRRLTGLPKRGGESIERLMRHAS